MFPRLLLFLSLLYASSAISAPTSMTPGGKEILEDPAQYIKLVLDDFESLNNIIYPSNSPRTEYLLPFRVEKGTVELATGIYTWLVAFRRYNCPIGKNLTWWKCDYVQSEKNVNRRFEVTLTQQASSSQPVNKWSAVEVQSSDELQLWKDIDMINVELPGNNLYYFIPLEIFLAYNSSANERTYVVKLALSTCRKARDIPTKKNCPIADPTSYGYFELKRMEDNKNGGRFVMYNANVDVLEKQCTALKSSVENTAYVNGMCFVARKEEIKVSWKDWPKLHEQCRQIKGYKGHLAYIPDKPFLKEILVSGAVDKSKKYFIGARQDPIPDCSDNGDTCDDVRQRKNWYFVDNEGKKIEEVKRELWTEGEPGNQESPETIAVLESFNNYLGGLNDMNPDKEENVFHPLCQYYRPGSI